MNFLRKQTLLRDLWNAGLDSAGVISRRDQYLPNSELYMSDVITDYVRTLEP